MTGHTTKWCLVFAVVLGSGCKPGFEDYPAALEKAWCEWQHGCHAYERVKDCVAAEAIDRDLDFAYLREAVAAGTVEYDQEAADACLEAIAGRSCDADAVETPEACDRVFKGRIGRNGPCMNSVECAGDAVCGFNPNCSDECCVGACRVFADPLEVGEPCGGSVDCVEGAFCAIDPMTFMATVCTKHVKVGGSCANNERCVEEAICDGSECREPKLRDAGESCDGPLDRCKEPAYCGYDGEKGGSYCVKPLGLGAPCNPGNDECARFDSYCHDTTRLCVLLPGAGAACADGRCAEYAYCKGQDYYYDEFGEGDAGFPGTCVRRAKEGEACEGDEYVPCLGDLECLGGTCRFPPLDNGQVCPVPEDG